MTNFNTVAVLGSTGYIGLELVKILLKHSAINVVFLGSENSPNQKISTFDKNINDVNLPQLSLNSEFDPSKADLVFLCLPHGVSHNYVKKYYNKIKIIDLSADFRLDYIENYKENYGEIHSCPELLNKFCYGLVEINTNLIKKSNYIAVPGCYPTSILIPLIPLLRKKVISSKNIIIDSKSGYSGAGKKFDIKNIKNQNDYNFYNYNTNEHRHICEIQQELDKYSDDSINFSFNPHVLPAFRGMLTTIYVDLENDKIEKKDIDNIIESSYQNFNFVRILKKDERADFFLVQNTNNCFIKLYRYNNKKLIIVSLIDNLIKGGAGQAIQCMNLIFGHDESMSF